MKMGTLLLLTLSTSLIGVLVIDGFVQGPLVTISSSTDMDAYVNSPNFAINYGASPTCLVGNLSGSGWAESYYHFNLTSMPTTTHKVHIAIPYTTVSDDISVDASYVSASWNEPTITWGSKPAKNQTIMSVLLLKTTESSVKNLIIEVTSIFTAINAPTSEFTLCLNATSLTQIGLMQGVSREGATSPASAPQIIYSYDAPSTGGENTGIPGYPVLLLVIFVLGTAVFLGKTFYPKLSRR